MRRRVCVFIICAALLATVLMTVPACFADSASVTVRVRVPDVIRVGQDGAARSNVTVLEQFTNGVVTVIAP